MEVNTLKSTIKVVGFPIDEISFMREKYPFQLVDMEDSIKYLGFRLKPNDYRKTNWMWLIENTEKWINLLCHN